MHSKFPNRVPCYGDSGAGLVVLTKINKDVSRYVLAAVHDGSVNDQFIDIDRNSYGGPCGIYAWNDKRKKYLQSAETAQSTSSSDFSRPDYDIFNWIKTMAGIKKSAKI